MNPANADALRIPGLSLEVCQSLMGVLEAQLEVRCAFCGGRGHELKECMSLIKATRAAKKCGIGYHFGNIKGEAYFRDYDKCHNIEDIKVKLTKV